MKKCDYYKDLILTDYIDGEMEKNSAGSLESHLLSCSDCRVFLKEIKDHGVLPAFRQPVPAQLWDLVRQDIERENQATGTLADIIEKLKGWIVLPKLVPVFASFIVMFLAGSATLNTMHFRQAQAKDQGEYLVSLMSTTDAGSNDLGTPIEHFFL